MNLAVFLALQRVKVINVAYSLHDNNQQRQSKLDCQVNDEAGY